MPRTSPYNWAWKRLLGAATPNQRRLNYRRPDFMQNAQGMTVRFHAPHPITPAAGRFMEKVRKIEIDGEECWRWTGGETFRVDDDTVTTPARFIYQEATGEKLRRGDKLRQTCKTPRCIRPAHREKMPVKQGR
jgi:hypothetical protein